MRFAGTDVVYTGEWKDSNRHGQGKLVFDKAEKCFYEGMLTVCNVHTHTSLLAQTFSITPSLQFTADRSRCSMH